MRAKYPSLPPSLPLWLWPTLVQCMRTAENMSRVTASFTILTASEVALSGAALQGWYHLVNLVRGNGYFRAALWKNYFFPPHWSDTEEGEREYSERRERNAWYSNCGCAQKRFERGAGQPRVFFPSFFFFPLFERGANRVSTSVLVHAHAVTNGHDRYPYLNTGRKY